MAYGYKYDEQPLLAPGRHFLNLFQVKVLCVTSFLQSVNRPGLFHKFEKFVQEILTRRIYCDVMINGSFLTEKIEPNDIDIAVHISFDFSENLNPDQKSFLDGIIQARYTEGLDTFVEVEYPRDHEAYDDWKLEKSWGEQWGVEHSKRWCKGVVVLRLWETNVGLRIRR